ncbi:unnamed protein product, partial [Rotaria sordida]
MNFVPDNLGRAHINALKQAWIALIDAISKETSLQGKQIADSVYGDELFRAVGYDNPDVFMLRWLRSRKWNVNTCVSQIMETLKWRHDWGVQELIANGERAISQEEIATGKAYFMGHNRFIPPTAEDEVMFNAFRADTKGKAIAEAAHRDAVQNYLSVTLQWTNGNENGNILSERKKVRKQLRHAFEERSPYISTRTHYHRIGV